MRKEDIEDWLIIILMITVEVIIGVITVAAIIAIGTLIFFLGVECGNSTDPGVVCSWMVGRGGDG